MSAFVDTSLLYASLDADAARHEEATGALREAAHLALVTSNYVLVETVALTQRRLGPTAVRRLLDDVVPALDVEWVDREVHEYAAGALRGSGRRGVSLVDEVSFEVMRRRGIGLALTLDRHFRDAGFTIAPA